MDDFDILKAQKDELAAKERRWREIAIGLYLNPNGPYRDTMREILGEGRPLPKHGSGP